MRGRRLWLLVVAALVATLGPSCSGGGTERTTTPAAKVDVRPSEAASLRVGKASVKLPRGAVADAGELTGRVVASPPPAPRGMRFDGPVYEFSLSGTRLVTPAHLTLRAARAPRRSAGPAAALLAFYDPGTKAWVPVEGTYDEATAAVSGTSPHFSFWTRLVADTGALLRGASDLAGGFFGTKDSVAQPTCPDEGGVRAEGVQVTSDKGGLVKWCLGKGDAGQAVLRIANNRHYAMATTYPSTWTMRRLGDPAAVIDRVATDVARRLTPPPAGAAVVIIPGAETVELTVPPGAGGRATTEPSVGGYLVDAFAYGLETLELTMGKIPGAPAVDPSKSRRVVEAALDSKACLLNLDQQIHTEVKDASSAGKTFRNAADLATGCLGNQWEVAYGLTGLIGSFVAKVILWLAEGVKLVLDGVRAAIETAIYWRSYRIAVVIPAPTALTDQQLLRVVGRCQDDACEVAARFDGLDGPSGKSTLAFVLTGESMPNLVIALVGPTGKVEWVKAHDAAALVPGYTDDLAQQDATGNILAAVPYGAHTGSGIVLWVTPKGVVDFGSLAQDRFAGDLPPDFEDARHNGVLDIVTTVSDYTPDFAESTMVRTRYRWNGSAYIVVSCESRDPSGASTRYAPDARGDCVTGSPSFQAFDDGNDGGD